MTKINRREFIGSVAAATAVGAVPGLAGAAEPSEAFVDEWLRETDLVKKADYLAYMKTGANPKKFVSIDRLEQAFDRVCKEVGETTVTDVPAVWMVYNMGVVVKTKESLFSIDLCHRRATELVPKLDFALITHNHGDHYTKEFYAAMDGARKIVVNNFIDNYGGSRWRSDIRGWDPGGYTRAEKVFKLKDVEVRTSLTDHNNYLVDYTTAFEIRVGNWKMLHTGDCSNYAKLKPIWGTPDLWIQGLGFGNDPAVGEKLLHPKLTAVGHMTELGHDAGRMRDPRGSMAAIRRAGGKAVFPRWGERIKI